MQIDIISDTVCPWCYVGKRRLEAAMAARPDIQFELEWRPFELNPDMPREGLDRQTYLAEKGLNIGDYKVLTDIAGEVGMDANLVGMLLEKGSDAEQIGELEKIAHEMGVTGVPCFVIERKYAIVGAESSEKFLQVFDGIIAEQESQEEA